MGFLFYNIMEEIWKDIIGYEGLYQISNYGRVQSCFKYQKYRSKNILKSPKILKLFIKDNGYVNVTLTKNLSSKKFYVHRLVAFHFLDKIENKSFVNHIDKNKSNNHFLNLEWVNSLENSYHSVNNEFTNVTKSKNKFRARITFNSKRITIGYYYSKLEAINAIKNYCLLNNIENKYL